ncbi:HPP family protein [Undibacterium sp. TJN19]|uniref:HPP family protein n=1 Tax=Undibacterium sp. TJN19 TaxID=3413055 RepID=UPI003BF259AE
MLRLAASEIKMVALKSFLLLSLLMTVCFYTGVTAMVAPFSASCVLLVMLQKSPFTAPRTLLLAHLICLSAGLIGQSISPPTILLVGAATWVALLAMAWLRAVHAPALAHTVILCLGKQDPTRYLPTAMLVVLLLAISSLVFAKLGDRG